MDSNLEIIKVLFENNCQRIVECKNIKTNEKYIYNTIINQNLIKLIDIVALNNLKSNILKCYKTQDRLYIVTRPHKENNQFLLKEYIDKNELTLKQQFMITEQLINIFIEIYNTTDLLQYKIINFKNLSIDNNNTIYVNGYFEFKDEFDLSDNFSYKNIGHIIHYLFSKEEIIDYNISDKIPPDILKIIVKCLTREYFHPKDLLKEFKGSPIYDLIICKTNVCNTVPNTIHKSGTNTEIKINGENILKTNASVSDVPNVDDNIDNIEVQNDDNLICEELYNDNINNLDENIQEFDTENQNVEDFNIEEENLSEEDEIGNEKIIDIYLNSIRDDANAKVQTQSNRGIKLMKFFIPAFIIVFVTVVSIFLLKSLYTKEQPANGGTISNNISENNQNSNNNTDGNSSNQNSENNEDENIDNNDKEDSEVNNDFNDKFSDYLNEDILQKIKYTGSYAVIDTENYNNGNYSLAVENTNDGEIKSLFAVIDFKNEKFRLMNNNQICVSAKFKAKQDVKAKLTVEVYKDGALLTEDSGVLDIYDDVWSQKLVYITINDFDRVNLYLEYSGQNKIWIDSINADITK